MKTIVILSVILLLFSSLLSAEPTCTLTMTYKDVGKPGYMAPSPDNTGLYQALYSEAAHKIGCSLEIKRFPKKRTLRQLQAGKIDIYPSTGFDKNRSLYMHYIPNGLFRNETYYGLTPIGVDEIDSIDDIRDSGLTWIIEAGRTTVKKAKKQEIPYQALVGLTSAKAIKMISWNRKVFYQIDTEDYDSYLEEQGASDLTHLNIKTHKHCCAAKSQKLYAGISRFSPIYREEPNPYYDPLMPISPENFPTQLVPGSIGHKLSLALEDIYSSGKLSLLLSEHDIELN